MQRRPRLRGLFFLTGAPISESAWPVRAQPECRSRNGWHGRLACAVRPLAGRNGGVLPLKTGAMKSSGASSFPGGESPPGTGQWPVLPIGRVVATTESGFKLQLADSETALLPIRLMQLHRLEFFLPSHPDVQTLHADRERHREVDVALWNLLVETLRHQRAANEHQEAQRQHLQ